MTSADEPRRMPLGTQSPDKFVAHIQGVQWPASKEQLVEKARSAAAPPEIIEGILRLPGDRFEGPAEVMVAYERAFPDR